MNKISIMEVKEALRDTKFRSTLPSELKDDIIKYEQNPNCPCNLGIYRNILKYASKQLINYYPDKEVINPDLELPPLRENQWTVINCSVNEIEQKLKEFSVGDYQIVIARWQDQATLVINSLNQIS